MNTQAINKRDTATQNSKDITVPTMANARIVQLDTVLNRSSFIWARKPIQASNNN